MSLMQWKILPLFMCAVAYIDAQAPRCRANEMLTRCPRPDQTCGLPAPLFCPSLCGAAACRCRTGWVRNARGVCTPLRLCPKPPTRATIPPCKPGERFQLCSSPEATCTAPAAKAKSPGPPKCQCQPGYVRLGGQCVRPFQCPTIRPPTTTPPSTTTRVPSATTPTSTATSSSTTKSSTASTIPAPKIMNTSQSTSTASLATTPMTTTAAAPPSTWQEHWLEHNQALRLVGYTPQVAVYYDADVSNKVAWPKTVADAVWVYTKDVYGSFGSDPRLFVVLHAGKYFGGHPATYFDSSHDNRNTIDVGLPSWLEGNERNAQGLDVITHEIAHIVEFASKGVHDSPAFEIWGDSKWAEIYNYDVYHSLGWTADAERWYNAMVGSSDSFPRANTFWFRDWFYPIYRDHGEAAVLNNFFTLLAAHFPRKGTSYARRMNMGEFVHFWSGAVKTNLKERALMAFGPKDRNGADWRAQLDQARLDFSGVQYDQTEVPVFVVYDDYYHKGASQSYELTSSCNNGLASSFNDRVSSVDSRGACVRLFQHSNCRGTSIMLKPDCGSSQGCWPNHGDLSGSGLDNGASSSIKC